MVDPVTDKWELLVIPREKKIFRGISHSISFRERFRSSKQIGHGYRSLSIAYMLQGTS